MLTVSVFDNCLCGYWTCKETSQRTILILGVGAMPISVTGRQLPNPREISIRLFLDKQLIDPVWNLNAQQWGQIITHDMSLTAGVAQTRTCV